MRHDGKCPADGTDYHGRCVGVCRECDDHLLTTGRYTVYCPSCNCCPDCGCPDADGFTHYSGCATAASEEADRYEENEDADYDDWSEA